MRRLVPALAVTALGLVLALLPPTRVMGYEHAFLATIGLALLAPLLVRLSWPWRLGAALVPAAFGLLSALWVKNCNLHQALIWYAVLTLPCALLDFEVARLLERARYYYAWLALDLAWRLWNVYRGPSIRVFDPFMGFFAGSLYDEALPLPPALLWHQLMTGLSALALTGLGDDPRRRPLRRLGAIAALVAVALWARGAALGFRVSRRDLAQVLDQAVVTPHLIVHVRAGGAAAKSVGRWWPEAELAAERVAKALQVPQPEPVHVYVYESPGEKQALMGASYTLFTRPWRPEIHLLFDGGELPVLDHELVHAIARSWNDSIFHVPVRYGVVPNNGLIEGLAVAVAPHQNVSPHLAAAALLRAHKLPDVSALMTPLGFYADSSERAYLTAGSFVRWLLDTRGVSVVRAAYQSGDIAAATGRSLIQLGEDYRTFLQSVPLDETLARTLAEEMRTPALYARVCGREFAERRAAAGAAIARGDYAEAMATYAQMAADDPADPDIAVLRAEALQKQAARGGDEAAFVAAAETLLARGAVAKRDEIRLREGLARQATGRGADEEVARQLAAASALAVEPDDVRRLAVARALADAPELRPLLPVLSPELPESQALVWLGEAFHAAPFSPLVNYLYGRRLLILGDGVRAFSHLRAALAGPALPVGVGFEAQRLCVEIALSARDPTAAAQAGALLSMAETEPQAAVARRLAERAEFYAAHPTW